MPCRFYHLSYDVIDAMSSIGDQGSDPQDVPENGNSNVKRLDSLLLGGDDGREGRKSYSENQKENSLSNTLKSKESSLLDNNATLPFVNEIDEELSDIADSVSSSIDASSQPFYRRKWATNVDPKILIEHIKMEPEDNDEEEKETMNTNHRPTETRESHLSSFGRIPQLKELAYFMSLKDSSTRFVQNEAETEVVSLNKSVQELIPMLHSMISILNKISQQLKIPREMLWTNLQTTVETLTKSVQELVKSLESAMPARNVNLQKLKALSKEFSTKPQVAPRKKRSVTTFSSSENQFQGKKCSRNEPGTERGSNKLNPKFLELKSKDYTVGIDSLGSNNALMGTRIEEKPIEKNNVGIRNTLRFEKRVLDQNKEIKDINTKETEKNDFEDIRTNDTSRCDKGIVNKGFVMDNDELYRHRRQQHSSQNSKYANGYKRITLDEPNPFIEIRNSMQVTRRTGNFNRHHIQQMSSQHPRSEFPNVGEGGDVFGSNRRHCSVATETEPMLPMDDADRKNKTDCFVNGNTERDSNNFKNANSKIIPKTHLHNQKPSLTPDPSSKRFPFEEETTDILGEREEIQVIKPTKKSSSLNPCAQSFNPKSKFVKDAEVLKSVGETETIKLEERSSNSAHLPIINVSEDKRLWDYEVFENDFLQREYQDADSDEHAVLLTMEELEEQDNFENDSVRCPHQEKGHDELKTMFSSEHDSNATNSVSDKKRQSITKLAEGDQNLEDGENRAERCDSEEKQEELCLNSASGDFVASENNDGGEENGAPDSIGFVVGIPSLTSSSEDSCASQRHRQEEEMELNFACFSGSDSSEMDSSDISEEETEFSGEKDKTKFEERP